MATVETTVTPGTQVVSVRTVPGGKGYYAPAVYEARARRDGTLTWRLVERPLGRFWFQGRRMEVGYRSERKALAKAQDVAFARGLRVLEGIRHGSRVG